MKIALLSYSTKPRGGVVHTLALAEALAALGEDVTVWTLGRGGDAGFFRPVHPAVRVQIVPFPDGPPTETVGERILRSIATLRTAFDPTPYDVVHAQDCISANAAGRCVRTVHHLDHFTTPELAACHERAIVEPYAHVCVSEAVAGELAAGWGIEAQVIPNGVAYDRFAATDPAAQASWRPASARTSSPSAASNPARAHWTSWRPTPSCAPFVPTSAWSSRAARRSSTTATTGRTGRRGPPNSP